MACEYQFFKESSQSGHSVSSKASFKTMHTVRSVGSTAMQMENLCTAEAISIHQFKFNLCVQKQ